MILREGSPWFFWHAAFAIKVVVRDSSKTVPLSCLCWFVDFINRFDICTILYICIYKPYGYPTLSYTILKPNGLGGGAPPSVNMAQVWDFSKLGDFFSVGKHITRRNFPVSRMNLRRSRRPMRDLAMTGDLPRHPWSHAFSRKTSGLEPIFFHRLVIRISTGGLPYFYIFNWLTHMFIYFSEGWRAQPPTWKASKQMSPRLMDLPAMVGYWRITQGVSINSVPETSGIENCGCFLSGRFYRWASTRRIKILISKEFQGDIRTYI